jgi:anti-anti-sigma regulatory factor
LLLSNETEPITLKITIDENTDAATLRLEGRVVGPWVAELERTWQSLIRSLGTRKLSIDLRGVTHMSSDAREILSEMHSQTGAQFIADSPMTKHFAEEARRRSDQEGK